MKQRSTLFLQGVVVLTGMVALAILIRFPLIEGRAATLDLFSIYTDPFILYGYATSMPFFIALFQVFKILGYIRQDKAFTIPTVRTLRSIRYCAILLSILLMMAGLYIRIFHPKEDDPAGFLAVCMAATFIFLVVAAAVAVFEKILQHGVDIKSANEHLYGQSK
ncbi:MAG: DUF2975 domain-containing protein [Cyclobacteriaceae bacterium]|nr:DUF2975 domain-containing protein [Cyclobacteriaceae bacterium]